MEGFEFDNRCRRGRRYGEEGYGTDGRSPIGSRCEESLRRFRRFAQRFTDAIRSRKQLQWIHVRHEEVAAAARVILRQARFAACQGDETSFVSHLSAHLWDAAECKRGESQSRTRTASPRESESHDRRLHAGSRTTEARRTEQFGQTGAEGRDFGDQAGLSGSNWIMKKSGGIAEAFYFFAYHLITFLNTWRPQ